MTESNAARAGPAYGSKADLSGSCPFWVESGDKPLVPATHGSEHSRDGPPNARGAQTGRLYGAIRKNPALDFKRSRARGHTCFIPYNPASGVRSENGGPWEETVRLKYQPRKRKAETVLMSGLGR